jgi:hypothetical protein
VVRSDSLAALTPAGRLALVEYGVRSMVDLRLPGEVAERPNPFARPGTHGIAYANVSFIDPAAAPPNPVSTLAEDYLQMLDRYRPGVAEAMAAIARAPEGAVVIHCAAGKDRTGLISALLLGLAGVPADTIAADYAAALAEHAERLPVGDPTRDDVAMGPIIDERQRDNVHRVVTESVDAGANLRAGGTYEGLFYRPTVLSDVPLTAPAYAQEIFGPVAPVVAFSGLDEAAALANGTEYGLSLGILTRDVMKGLALAERIPSGLVHINDQTVNDEALIPFGGVGESGTGSRHGGTQANLDAFTEVQWVTVRGDLPQYPF